MIGNWTAVFSYQWKSRHCDYFLTEIHVLCQWTFNTVPVQSSKLSKCYFNYIKSFSVEVLSENKHPILHITRSITWLEIDSNIQLSIEISRHCDYYMYMAKVSVNLLSMPILAYCHNVDSTIYSASQKKQNCETMECCKQVLECMIIIIYISWSMINMLSNDTLLKFLQSCFTEQHCFQNWMSKSIRATLQKAGEWLQSQSYVT